MGSGSQRASLCACSSGGGDGSGELVRHLINYQQVLMGPWVLPKLNSLAKEHPPGARVTVRGKVSWKRPGERPSPCLCDMAAAQESLA